MRTTRRDIALGLGATALARTAWAQTPEPSGLSRREQEGRYLPLWREVVGPPKPRFNVQTASFVGEEAVALRGPNGFGNPFELAADAQAQDAVSAIVAASRGRRVVMLNEAHTASRHRAFLARLLRALRPEGFDILTAEGFVNSKDPAWPNIRDMPRTGIFPPRVGFYTSDPIFADTVREAVSLGYKLEAHEWGDEQVLKSGDSKAQIAARETAQAANLEKIVTANPDSRVLVFVGYSHLRKTPDGAGSRWMASRFLENTGIDPLTVSQANTGSFGPHGKEIPMAQAVLARFSPRAPIVVSEGGVWLGARQSGADMAVFHPSLPDVDGRPGWLAADPVRKRVMVKVPKRPAGEVVIVQAIHAHEPELAVPADQHVLAKGQDRAVLFLRPGAYRLRIENDAGFTPLGARKV